MSLYRHNETRTRRTDPIYFIAEVANNGTNAGAKEIVSKQYTDSDTFKIYSSCQDPLLFSPLFFILLGRIISHICVYCCCFRAGMVVRCIRRSASASKSDRLINYIIYLFLNCLSVELSE